MLVQLWAFRLPPVRSRFGARGFLVALLSISLFACVARPAELPTRPPVALSGFVEVGGDSLHYTVAGSGRPVVFLGASAMDLTQWDDQVEPFSREFLVVRFDFFGWGKSSALRRQHSPVNVVRALFDRLGISRAHLVGQSAGGSLALDFAIAYPERVDALVLVSSAPSGYQWSPAMLERLAQLARVVQQQGVAGLARDLLDDPYFAPGAVTRPSLGGRIRANILSNEAFWQDPDSNLLQPLIPPAIQRLGTVRARTLIVTPQLDYPEMFAVADTLVARIPNATKAVIPDAGHVVHMEQPDAFNRLVIEFLRRP